VTGLPVGHGGWPPPRHSGSTGVRRGGGQGAQEEKHCIQMNCPLANGTTRNHGVSIIAIFASTLLLTVAELHVGEHVRDDTKDFGRERGVEPHLGDRWVSIPWPSLHI
jgi:hypothetical protein